MARRQEQIKQVWLSETDDKIFEQVAAALKEQQIDVEADNKRSKSPYSHTKVMRYLLHKAAKELGIK